MRDTNCEKDLECRRSAAAEGEGATADEEEFDMLDINLRIRTTLYVRNKKPRSCQCKE